MRKLNLTKQLLMVMVLSLIVVSCSENEPIDVIDTQTQDYEEVAMSAQVDEASEIVDEIAIDAYEEQETSENPVGRTTGIETRPLPECVTVTVVAEQNLREITIDFGEDGCEVRGHTLKGKILLSYTRNPDAREKTITKTFEDFYFNDKNIEGSKTILKQRSNENGNPQFTKTVNITITWSDGAEASREGTKIREWVEGYGSGVWSDNVFEVTGNWTTTFRNGVVHSKEVIIPLRREVVCRFFVSGSIDVNKTNRVGTLDYGDGDCDNQATFIFEDGTVREITLR